MALFTPRSIIFFAIHQFLSLGPHSSLLRSFQSSQHPLSANHDGLLFCISYTRTSIQLAFSRDCCSSESVYCWRNPSTQHGCCGVFGLRTSRSSSNSFFGCHAGSLQLLVGSCSIPTFHKGSNGYKRRRRLCSDPSPCFGQ